MELEKVRIAAYTVPLDVSRADGTLAWDATTVVTVEVTDTDGCSGLGWTYGPRACAVVVEDLLAPAIIGRDLDDIAGAWGAMTAAVRNAGVVGVCSMAISAVDIALWDLKARRRGVPLTDLFGRTRDDVPVYWSGGFTSYSDSQLRDEFDRCAVGAGIGRAKMKIGSAPLEVDVRRMRAARDTIGDGELMIDANGAYNRKRARTTGRAAADLGVVWFEEPVTSDDPVGLGWLRDELDMEIAAGEYGYTIRDFTTLADVVDVLQVDATRCGGFTGWFRAATVAASRGLEVSAHTAHVLHMHVAAATSNLRHIEFFADHHEVDRVVFDPTPRPSHGALRPDGAAPGLGVSIKQKDAAPFLVASATVGASA